MMSQGYGKSKHALNLCKDYKKSQEEEFKELKKSIMTWHAMVPVLSMGILSGLMNSIIGGKKMGLFDDKKSIVRELISTIDEVAQYYESKIEELKDQLDKKDAQLSVAEDNLAEQIETNTELEAKLKETKKKPKTRRTPSKGVKFTTKK